MNDELKERWPYCTNHGWVFKGEHDICALCEEVNARA